MTDLNITTEGMDMSEIDGNHSFSRFDQIWTEDIGVLQKNPQVYKIMKEGGDLRAYTFDVSERKRFLNLHYLD